jgi:hypothetical protein
MKKQKSQFLLASRTIGAIAALAISTLAAKAAYPAGTSCDPGPRPVGSQVALFAGPINASGVPLLTTPVPNTRQPTSRRERE